MFALVGRSLLKALPVGRSVGLVGSHQLNAPARPCHLRPRNLSPTCEPFLCNLWLSFSGRRSSSGANRIRPQLTAAGGQQTSQSNKTIGRRDAFGRANGPMRPQHTHTHNWRRLGPTSLWRVYPKRKSACLVAGRPSIHPFALPFKATATAIHSLARLAAAASRRRPISSQQAANARSSGTKRASSTSPQRTI